ncbi:MAG: hypothetical protein ACR2G4_11705 [Pyrinomonadaceae bacterium]
MNIELLPGGGTIKQVTLTSDQNLRNITIEAVPEIAGLVSVQPNAISSVFADQPQAITA